MLHYEIVKNYLEKRAYELLLSAVQRYKYPKWKPKDIYIFWCSQVDALNVNYLSDIGCPYHFSTNFKKNTVFCNWMIKVAPSEDWFGFSCAWDLTILKKSRVI